MYMETIFITIAQFKFIQMRLYEKVFLIEVPSVRCDDITIRCGEEEKSDEKIRGGPALFRSYHPNLANNLQTGL